MPLWKWLILNVYYHASQPARWWIYRRLAARRRMPIMAIYFHRVSDDGASPCTMPSQTFIRQVTWLRKNFDLVSFEEAQRRIRSKVSDRPAVHITFDDGYSDNCQVAIPWLIREGIPCTYFVTARNVLECQPFDHDLCRGLKMAPNTLEQLRAMARAGLEIGAHSYSHLDLGRLTDPACLRQELAVARDELRAAIGQPVRYFSFPYGLHENLSCLAFDMAAQCGYEGVCSAYGGYNYPGDDPFHLQRIPSVNEILRLKNWLTADPRKIHTRRFEYRWPEDRFEPTPEEAKREEECHVVSP
jgi:peptidoglycan/xylan/chitin deacetylase (PgdA/CDA1 family)